MKNKGWFYVLTVILLFSFVPQAWAANADNVYLGPVGATDSTLVMSDWSPTQTTPYTYWATQNWNQGAEGGGYAGFQQDAETAAAPRRAHFAIWDPIHSTLPIESKYAIPGATVSSFGGEGTGMKVMTPYNWELNQWYRMVVRTWDQDCTGTCFGQWVKDIGNNEWKLIAVLDHPVKGIKLHGGLGLFQEDWWDSSENVRGARVKNGYNLKVDGSWNSWATQRFSSNHTLGTWDGGATNDYFWFKSGGATVPSITSGTLKTITQPSTPVLDPIEFASSQAAYGNGQVQVSWKMKASSSPQLAYQIQLYDHPQLTGSPIAQVSETKPQADSRAFPATLAAGTIYYAKLTITDIFDRTQSMIIPFLAGGSSNPTFDPNAWYRIVNKNSSKVIDVPYSSTDQGVQLIQYASTNNPNQLWRIADAGASTFKLVNQHSNMAIETSEGSIRNGAAVVQNIYSGASHQLWALEPSGSGHYTISNANSGKALTVKGASAADGAVLEQAALTNGAEQLWSIVKVE